MWFLFACSMIDSTTAGTNLTPVESLHLPTARWGVEVENTIKKMSLGYDAKNDIFVTSGSIRARLAFVDPGVGHPVASVEIPVHFDNPQNLVRVDSDRRRAFWVGTHAEEIRVVDLDKRVLVAQRDGSEVPGQVSQIKDATIDPATGWLWVANHVAGRVMGYSPDLKQVVTVPGVTGPQSLSATADAVWIVDSPTPESGRVVKYTPSSQSITSLPVPEAPDGRKPRPPRWIAAMPDGSVALATSGILIVDPSGALRARVPLPGQAYQVVAVGKDLAATWRKPGSAEFGLSWILDGKPGPSVSVGFQAFHLVADPVHGRALVMEADDASIIAIDKSGKIQGPYEAGEGPEGVVVDGRTGTRYIVDRLGGSVIHVWKPGESTVKTWPMGRWPIEIAMDTDRRLLIALGHWDSGLFLWNIDEKKALTSIPSGAPANSSDAISDMDYDASVGLAGVAFPEHGFIGVIDVPAGKSRWGKQVEEFRRGNDSSGTIQVAVDGKNNRLYVQIAKPRAVIAYDLGTGAEVGRVMLGPWNREQAKGHIFNTLFLDRTNNRLFSGSDPISLPALKAGTRVPAQRVFYADASNVLAIRTSDDWQESLVQLDARSLGERGAWPLYKSIEIRPQPYYDARNKRLYIADLPEGRVRVFAWP